MSGKSGFGTANGRSTQSTDDHIGAPRNPYLIRMPEFGRTKETVFKKMKRRQ